MILLGTILVIPLLTILAAISRQFTHSMGKMLLLSTIVAVALTAGDLWLSYELKLVSGATIILLSGVLFLASLALTRLRNKKRRRVFP